MPRQVAARPRPSLSARFDPLLDYTLATDYLNGTIVAVTTFANAAPQQAFTVKSARSAVLIAYRVALNFAGNGQVGASINIDGSRYCVGQDCPSTHEPYGNPFAGGGLLLYAPGELAAGAHTLDLQFYALNAGGNAYLRAATIAAEGLSIQVYEVPL